MRSIFTECPNQYTYSLFSCEVSQSNRAQMSNLDNAGRLASRFQTERSILCSFAIRHVASNTGPVWDETTRNHQPKQQLACWTAATHYGGFLQSFCLLQPCPLQSLALSTKVFMYSLPKAVARFCSFIPQRTCMLMHPIGLGCTAPPHTVCDSASSDVACDRRVALPNSEHAGANKIENSSTGLNQLMR